MTEAGRAIRFTSRCEIPGSTKRGARYKTTVRTIEEIERDEKEAEEKKINAAVEESNKLMENIALDEPTKEVVMEVERSAKMTEKSSESKTVQKLKKRKRGNRRTLVY